MESKGALKLRWSEKEVKILVEEWVKVCETPGTRTLRVEQLNAIIFDRYNARCVQARELRRSPPAVNTQRDRMLRYARFVVEFDRTQLAQGRCSWHQLSEQEQLHVSIPNEWRRQIATFTPDVFDTFKRVILPTDTVGVSKRKKNKNTKWGGKRLKVGSQLTVKREQVATPVEPQPCWTPQEEVQLADRWGRFMQYKSLTLKAFDEMTYNQSCQRLATSTRPSVSAWRKSRALLTSWRFISSFNDRHQPGWFELSETERDQLIKWGELPDTFEDIERDVFLAMDEAVRKYVPCVKSEPLPPTKSEVPALSPLPVLLEPAPVLCTTDEGHSTDDTLDRLLLEDDEPGDFGVIGTLDDSTLLPDTSALIDGQVSGAAVVKEEILSATRSQSTVRAVDNTVHILAAKLETHMSRMQCALGDLQKDIAKEADGIHELVHTSRPDLLRVNASLAKHMKLVIDNQRKRLLTTLQFAEETCRQNGDELRPLMQALFSSRVSSAHVAAPAELELL